MSNHNKQTTNERPRFAKLIIKISSVTFANNVNKHKKRHTLVPYLQGCEIPTIALNNYMLFAKKEQIMEHLNICPNTFNLIPIIQTFELQKHLTGSNSRAV